MTLYLLSAEEGHAGDPHIDPMHPNLKAACWALGIFIVVLFVLRKFAWGPIVNGLAKREERIAASLEKAAEIEKATRELAETNQRMMEEAQQRAQGIVAESRETAKKAAEEIAAKAGTEIQAEKDRAKREMRLEVEKAKAELREETVNLTIGATAKLLGRMLDDDDHKRLAEEALKDAESVARN